MVRKKLKRVDNPSVALIAAALLFILGLSSCRNSKDKTDTILADTLFFNRQLHNLPVDTFIYENRDSLPRLNSEQLPSFFRTITEINKLTNDSVARGKVIFNRYSGFWDDQNPYENKKYNIIFGDSISKNVCLLFHSPRFLDKFNVKDFEQARHLFPSLVIIQIDDVKKYYPSLKVLENTKSDKGTYIEEHVEFINPYVENGAVKFEYHNYFYLLYKKNLTPLLVMYFQKGLSSKEILTVGNKFQSNSIKLP